MTTRFPILLVLAFSMAACSAMQTSRSAGFPRQPDGLDCQLLGQNSDGAVLQREVEFVAVLPKRSPALQREIDRYEAFALDKVGDLMIATREAGYELGEVCIKALMGDDDALHDLFVIATLVDGAASESYSLCLGDMLRAVGDVRFGERLAMEPAKVCKSVHILVSWELTGSMDPTKDMLAHIHQKYPITFQQRIPQQASR